VDKIPAAKRANPQADVTAWEREIDQLVYRLYGLSPAEIKIAEKATQGRGMKDEDG
jgi:adenine-specific DNA-methyltransferase